MIKSFFRCFIIFSFAIYLILSPQSALAACQSVNRYPVDTTNPNYRCQVSNNQVIEFGLDCESNPAYDDYYTCNTEISSCGSFGEAQRYCGSGSSSPLAGLGCSITAPDSVQHGQRIDWGVGIEPGRRITNISVGAGGTAGVCDNLVGNSTSPCTIGSGPGGNCSGYSNADNAVRVGTCQLTISTDGGTSCTRGVAVNCTPSGTNTLIGFPTNAAERAILNNGNNYSTGTVCNPATFPSLNYAAHSNAPLVIPPEVRTICVKGRNSESLNNQLLRYYDSQNSQNNVDIRYNNANNNVGYAFRVRSIIDNAPNRNHTVAARSISTQGYCMSYDYSPSLFSAQACPSTIDITGNVSGNPSTVNVRACLANGTCYTSNNIAAGGGSYTITTPPSNSYTLSTTDLANYTETPGPTGLTVGCADAPGPSFTYSSTCPASVTLSGPLNLNGAGTVSVCANAICANQSTSTWSLTVPSNTSYTVSAPTNVNYFTKAVTGTNPVAVACANTTGPTVTYTAANPDLTITTPVFSISSGLTGGTNNPATAVIRNASSNATLGSANAGFIWNTSRTANPNCTGVYNTNYTIPALAGNGNTTANLTFTLPATAGNYTGCVRLDTANTIPEGANESNNVFFADYVVSNPRYFVTLGGDISAKSGSITNPSPGTNYLSSNTPGRTDAGVVLSSTTLSPATNITQLGTAPGVGASSYPLSTPIFTTSPITGADPTYGTFLDNVVKNLGFLSYSEFNTPLRYCNGSADSGAGSLTNNDRIVRGTTTYHLWCTTPTVTLEAVLARIATVSELAPSYFHIVVPHPTLLSASQTIGAKNFTGAAKNIIVFVNGALSISGNITAYPASTLTAIMNTSPTSLSISGGTTSVDGAFVMPGTIDDNSDNLPSPGTLNLRGVLIATGNVNLGSGLKRSVAGAPGEVFTYDPRYLSIVNGVITRPTYTWKELPPQ